MCDYGQENQEGGSHRKIRNPLWFFNQKNREEIRATTTCQVCLPRMWQGKPSIIQSQVRRAAAGIWKCRGCKTTFAGGAFEFATSVATTAKVTMNRLKKLKEELNSAKQEE